MKTIPVKLDDKMAQAIDRLVDLGLYLSRSEALREGARRLVLADYLSVNQYLKRVASIAAQIIIASAKEVAEVKLFGSVAKRTAHQESDIDLVIITKGEPSLDIEQKIHELLLPVSLGANVLITPIIMSRKKFQHQTKAGYAFANEVQRFGITLAASKDKYGDHRASA